MPELHDIGWAVKQMQNGQRVSRAGWNGKKMWLTIIRGDREPRELSANIAIGSGWGDMRMTDYVVMKTATGEFTPWLCSQSDLLATDWGIA